MIKQDLEAISDKILSMNSKVRFVEIVYRDETCIKMRQGLDSLLSTKETEESIDGALVRWETRKKMAHKLGEPVYAMAEYKKVKRITIPINDDGLILVSIDSTGFHEVLLKEIIDLKEKLILD